MSLPKLTSLNLSMSSKPTYEMISSLKEEAMSFPPGKYRIALLNQARRMEERLNYLNELDKKDFSKNPNS